MQMLDKAAMMFDRNTVRRCVAVGVGHTRCSVPDAPHMATFVDVQPTKDQQGFRRIKVNMVVYSDAGQCSFSDFVEMLYYTHDVRNVTMRTKDTGYWSILREKRIHPQQARYIDRSAVQMIYPKEYTGEEQKMCTELAFAAASTALLEIEHGLSFV